ncbi:hypothetical protein PP914_gp130 [Arthrobacter phage Qui]|uniref:Uncharacterized protein n=1 Tax=Arthrobacter phage Qui TaxID=2603260 RepID=A0A5B8WHV0_9CAUD|nr:hypothetical protein PP914_gp130 [Arthrobacter phage Qui]QED11619.1 hypothetical protein SEA_QUI_130 [Arthrobacter phage Qui]QOC56451.1 hypothetical protein SEA_PAELLA_130 [Arthrobacter phage Paella]
MTLTSHAHHIAGTPTDDTYSIVPVNCGGPTVCETCDFEIRWYKDQAKARHSQESTHIFPSEIDGLDSQILRKIAAKLRDKNPRPSRMMIIPRYQLASTIYALADAIDSVADDQES